MTLHPAVDLAVIVLVVAIGSLTLVTVLPRQKPVGDEIPPPVVYAPIARDTQAEVKLENLETRIRAIQRKLDRVESKVEGK